MRVLAPAAYPRTAAITSFRLLNLLPELSVAGIEVTVRPFLDEATYASLYDRRVMGRTAAGLVRAAARRMGDLVRAGHVDAVVVQREAMVFGPPVVERLATALGRCPLVLDLDDPTWVATTAPPTAPSPTC